MFTKRNIQCLSTSVDEAWDFLSDPKNLAKITPPDLRFEIVSGAEKKMYAGQIIQYHVRSFFGIKTEWIAEITYVKEKAYFVDEQRYGPYKMWHHKHFIRAIPNGVEMENIVDYSVPLGIFGKWIHSFIIKPKLDKIFEFRRQKLIEIFGEYDPEVSKTA
ncbi:SRPBCC family protein [Flavobacterium pallidum]|uniref:Cell division inhibitor n=1 Tax=Flavobacterium pallidum TaxID=2172098 RepID=A0A2S1SJX4_9FLAO|nr:SRPBCC family protein [Flavobacterium pallidum]AWI26662.1 cell division inhibitor [Flavobacterium pallidum]